MEEPNGGFDSFGNIKDKEENVHLTLRFLSFFNNIKSEKEKFQIFYTTNPEIWKEYIRTNELSSEKGMRELTKEYVQLSFPEEQGRKMYVSIKSIENVSKNSNGMEIVTRNYIMEFDQFFERDDKGINVLSFYKTFSFVYELCFKDSTKEHRLIPLQINSPKGSQTQPIWDFRNIKNPVNKGAANEMRPYISLQNENGQSTQASSLLKMEEVDPNSSNLSLIG